MGKTIHISEYDLRMIEDENEELYNENEKLRNKLKEIEKAYIEFEKVETEYHRKLGVLDKLIMNR